jgi:hypothetical protein
LTENSNLLNSVGEDCPFVWSQAALRPRQDSFAVKSKISRIRITRLALGDGNVPRPMFDLGAEMTEIGFAKGEVRVRYLLSIESFPSVQRAEVEGEATIKGERFESVDDLHEIEQGRLAKMAISIYRNDFESLYLILMGMGLEAPSPWVVKDVHLVLTSPQGSDAGQAELPSVTVPAEKGKERQQS